VNTGTITQAEVLERKYGYVIVQDASHGKPGWPSHGQTVRFERIRAWHTNKRR
jgi:hypothetical protein